MNVVNRCENCAQPFQHRRGDGRELCGACAPLPVRERYVLAVTDDMRTQDRLSRLAKTPLHELYPSMAEGLARLQEARPSAEAWKAQRS